MAISKVLPLSPSKFNNEAATIKCPVEEIGKNSVKPSTTPNTAALINTQTSITPTRLPFTLAQGTGWKS